MAFFSANSKQSVFVANIVANSFGNEGIMNANDAGTRRMAAEAQVKSEWLAGPKEPEQLSSSTNRRTNQTFKLLR